MAKKWRIQQFQNESWVDAYSDPDEAAIRQLFWSIAIQPGKRRVLDPGGKQVAIVGVLVDEIQWRRTSVNLNYSDIKQIASAATDAGISHAKESFKRRGLTLSSEAEQSLREALDELLIDGLAVAFDVAKEINDPNP